VRKFVLPLLLAVFSLFSCQRVSFSGAANDLARHLRDGELILGGQANEILHRNYYSYAHPEAVFINHHWLMSVIFYCIYKAAGLKILNAFYIALGAITFVLYFRVAEREAGLTAAAAAAALLMPLLALRAGLRPEVFSLLLLGVFFTILWGNYRGYMGQAWLWLLPVLEIFWVNLHPGFILGPVLVGAFLAAEALARRAGKRFMSATFPKLAMVGIATLLAGLANPNGWRGWLFPVMVSHNYAMPVRENLSPFALPEVWMATLSEIAVALLAAAWIWAYARKARIEWPLLLFSLLLAVMTLAFFRVYVFLGWFALVSVCVNIRAVMEAAKSKKKKEPARIPRAAVAGILAAAAVNGAAVLAPRWSDIGLGLAPHDEDLAAFLKTNQIAGRVFNSFPSGGYLIHYFPNQPVYIDNRPEAYPGAFIRDEYLRVLEDEGAWRSVQEKYAFDFICFARVNQEEGQFLLRRIHDPDWAPVLAGPQVVLVRRAAKFAAVIARREIKF